MSDEQEDQQQQNSPPPPEAEGDFTWGQNARGDLLIDGVVVEKNAHPPSVGPEGLPPSADPDEMAEIRRERDEMREKYERAEPFIHLAENPNFRNVLNEAIQRGEIEPALPPPPAPSDVREYRFRETEDPDFPVIRDIMTEWAQTLPEYEREILNSNHAVFVREYDRIKAESAGRLPKARPPILPAAYPNVPMNLRQIEASLRAKEVNKAQARVEPPGVVPEYPNTDDDGRAAEKQYATAKAKFAQARQHGTPTEIANAEQRMVEAFFERSETPKRGAGGVRGY